MRQQPDFRDTESQASMARRMDQFLDEYLLPIVLSPEASPTSTLAVVSHGILLSALWKCLLKRFALNSVSVAPNVPTPLGVAFTLDRVGSWSNTGYLGLSISKQAALAKSAGITEILTAQHEGGENDTSIARSAAVLYDWALVVHAINSREHLRGLKRTGGGVGSSRYDAKQANIESFFKS